MMYTLLSILTLSIFTISVRACEGQCIVEIAHAFIGNYSVPVQHVFAQAAANITRTILPPHSTAASKLIEPLIDAYERNAYNAMTQGIFPGHFHGKCQVNGVDPAGCPNSDCPVVCGTPGSMVHFFSDLRRIAFNVTTAGLRTVCAPSSKPFMTLEAAVLHELRAGTPLRRSLRSSLVASRLAPYVHARRSMLLGAKGVDATANSVTGVLQKRKEVSKVEVTAHLRSICGDIVDGLAKECGGKVGLPECSWEKEMKAFILSFP